MNAQLVSISKYIAIILTLATAVMDTQNFLIWGIKASDTEVSHCLYFIKL